MIRARVVALALGCGLLFGVGCGGYKPVAPVSDMGAVADGGLIPFGQGPCTVPMGQNYGPDPHCATGVCGIYEAAPGGTRCTQLCIGDMGATTCPNMQICNMKGLCKIPQ